MTQPDGVLARPPVVGLAVGSLLVVAMIATLVGPGPLAIPLVMIVLSLPGLSLIRLVRLGDPMMDILLGIVLSVSLLGLIALVQLALGVWHPPASAGALLLAGVCAAAVDVTRGLRMRSGMVTDSTPTDHQPREAAAAAGPRTPREGSVAVGPEVPGRSTGSGEPDGPEPPPAGQQ